MKLTKFNREDEKVQSFKKDLILQIEMNSNIGKQEKKMEYSLIEEKFSEPEYILLLDKEDNVLMATYISNIDFIGPRDAMILSKFEGVFIELIYSISDISFDEKEKEINTFLKLLSKEYSNILLYNYNISNNNRFYKLIKGYPSIHDETELISLNSDLSASKESTISIIEEFKSVQLNGSIKHVITKHVDMNDSDDTIYFRKLISEQLKVYNKSEYNQVEGLELANYSEVYNYLAEKNNIL